MGTAVQSAVKRRVWLARPPSVQSCHQSAHSDGTGIGMAVVRYTIVRRSTTLFYSSRLGNRERGVAFLAEAGALRQKDSIHSLVHAHRTLYTRLLKTTLDEGRMSMCKHDLLQVCTKAVDIGYNMAGCGEEFKSAPLEMLLHIRGRWWQRCSV